MAVVVVVVVVDAAVVAVVGDGCVLCEAGVIELEITKSSFTLGPCCQGKVIFKILN